MGSRIYAQQCRARGEHVVAMVSIEAVGYYSTEKKSQRYPFPLSWFYPSQGHFIAVVGNRESKTLVSRVAAAVHASGTLPVEKAALPGGIRGVGWSDHWSFWQEGFPAVMITD